MPATSHLGEWHTEGVDDLCRAMLTLRTAEEFAMFLRDLCTFNEIEELSGRWQIVRLLEQQKSYREIAAECGTSTATVTRVNQWRQRGAGGYRLALDRLGAG